MKSLNLIAKENGISHQALYKRFTPEYLKELGIEFTTERGGIRLDEAGEAAVKAFYNKVDNAQPDAQQMRNQITLEEASQVGKDTDDAQPDAQPLQDEVAYLRNRVEVLEVDLRVERERNFELALKFAEVSQSSQILIGMQKQGIFSRFFSRFRK